MSAFGSPSSSRLAWATLAALLLALLAWLLLRSGGEAGEKARSDRSPEKVSPAPGLLADPAAPARSSISEPKSAESESPVQADAPPAETLVYGALLDQDSQPIRGVWFAGVGLTDAAGLRRNAEIDADGNYSFRNLPFGRYWAGASAEGHRGAQEEIELLIEAPKMRKDFILQRSVQLRIRAVSPEGLELRAALQEMQASRQAMMLVPVATLENPGPRFEEVIGSLNNHFGAGHFWDYGPSVDRLPPGYLGLLVLDGDLPVWASLVHYHRVLQSQRVEPGQEEVTFVISPGDLLAGLSGMRVRVTAAATGLPIEGARLWIDGGNSPGSARTDAEGIAVVEGLAPGLLSLVLRADGFETFRHSLSAQPGAIADLGTIELHQGITVEGLVLDQDGHPRSDTFTLGLRDAENGAIQWWNRESFKSEANGQYKLQGLGRREYRIRSRNLDGLNRSDHDGTVLVLGATPCDTRSGSLNSFDLHLKPATSLVLQVADGRGDGLRFRVLDETGSELLTSRFYGPAPRPLNLPAGNYRVLLLDAAGKTLADRSVSLGADAVRLELKPE